MVLSFAQKYFPGLGAEIESWETEDYASMVWLCDFLSRRYFALWRGSLLYLFLVCPAGWAAQEGKAFSSLPLHLLGGIFPCR